MLAKRIIPCLDVDAGRVVKGIMYVDHVDAGDPVELGVSAASLYPVSLDAVMANIMGFEPLEIGYLYYLMDWDVGVADIGGIDIIGEPIKNIVVKFKPHPSHEDQLKWR